MLTFAQLFLEFIEFVWPVHRIEPWERGVLIVCGRWVWEVGPGVYPLFWWFMKMTPVSMVPETVNPGTIETITTKNGGTVSYGLLFEIECVDAMKAYLTVQEHDEKARRDSWGITADTLADLPEGRLDPEAQRSLRRTCVTQINKKLETYGMRCNALTFTTFVSGMRNYRLFTGA